MQFRLVVFEGKYILCFFTCYLFSDLFLAARRVYCDYMPFYVYEVEQLRYCRYFVCFVWHGYFA